MKGHFINFSDFDDIIHNDGAILSIDESVTGMLILKYFSKSLKCKSITLCVTAKTRSLWFCSSKCGVIISHWREIHPDHCQLLRCLMLKRHICVRPDGKFEYSCERDARNLATTSLFL